MKSSSVLLPALLAVFWTGLNAAKPPVIDDTAYLALASHMAQAPLDPYGFEQFWYQVPEPANHVLAPPVLPYWLSLGIRVFGENIVLLKLWLFPFAALFAFSLHALLQRFARAVSSPVLVATVLSSALLPAFNFMLDVPALALTLTAVELLLRALDKNSASLVLLAGLTAGLAAQTKYTGLLAVPLVIGISLMYRRVAPGLATALAAALLFLGWELEIHHRYGESHFWFGVETSDTSSHQKLGLFAAALPLLGGIGSGVTFVGLVALGCRRWWLIALIVSLAGGFLILATIPDTGKSYWLPLHERRGVGALALFLGAYGWAFVAVLAAVNARLLFRWRGWRQRFPNVRLRYSRDTLILILWLSIEIIGYFVLTPFPASRRLMGATVVAFLLAGRLASRTCRAPKRRRLLWLAAAGSAAFGLFYAGIDLTDARIEPDAVRSAAAQIRAHDDRPTVWFTGHWGLQYEAIRQGFRPLVPGQSQLQAGDWLLVPPGWMPQQDFTPDPRQGTPVHVVRIDRFFRLRTLPAYYGGHHTIEWWPSPFFELHVYRVEAPWTPE